MRSVDWRPGRCAPAAVALALLSLHCSKDSPVPPGPAGRGSASAAVTASAPAASGSARRPPPAPPTLDGRLYVDITLSMRGFVHADAKAFEEVLRIAKRAMGSAGAGKSADCSLGANAHACKKWGDFVDVDGRTKSRCVEWGELEATSCKRAPGFFEAESSFKADIPRFDHVLARAPLPERYDPATLPPDPLDDAGITVLAISGLDPGSLTTKEPSALKACQGGPSPACVSAALVERVREGYGAWWVTVMMPFDGDLLVGVTDKRHIDAVKQHVDSLKQVAPGEPPRFAGVDFKVGTTLKDAPGRNKTGTKNEDASLLSYKGVRPLSLLVLTKDPAKGRELVRVLVHDLKQSPVVKPGKLTDVVQAVELAPLPLPSFALTAVEKPTAQPGLDPVATAELRLTKSAVDGAGVKAELACGAQGKAWVVAHVQETAGPEALPPFVRVTTLLRGPVAGGGGPLTPNVSVCDLQKGECAYDAASKGYRLATQCGPLAVQAHAWLFEWGLRRKVTLDDGALERSFLGQQSSPDSYSMPERVFGLKEVARAVLGVPAVGDAAMGRVQLAVTRAQ